LCNSRLAKHQLYVLLLLLLLLLLSIARDFIDTCHVIT
jgi:hypothetical protein